VHGSCQKLALKIRKYLCGGALIPSYATAVTELVKEKQAKLIYLRQKFNMLTTLALWYEKSNIGHDFASTLSPMFIYLSTKKNCKSLHCCILSQYL
jgi:hypothetical protein